MATRSFSGYYIVGTEVKGKLDISNTVCYHCILMQRKLSALCYHKLEKKDGNEIFQWILHSRVVCLMLSQIME